MLHVEYQSTVHYGAEVDILRSNSSWHGHGARYDAVLIDAEEGDQPFTVARLRHLLHCHFPNRSAIDIAIVTRFKKPASPLPGRRPWDGCLILEEAAELSFVRLTALIHGALVCPVFHAPEDQKSLL